MSTDNTEWRNLGDQPNLVDQYTKAEQRAPLLSIEPDIDEIIKDFQWQENRELLAAEAVRNWYEAKITSGELRVVTAVRLDPSVLHENNWAECPGCKTECYAGDKFCRGCAAKIIE